MAGGRAPVALIAAVAENGVIGRDNAMPWHLSSDLKHFKATTLGKPVIMGRKTFQSIGKPLPGRHIIVVSRNPVFDAMGADLVGSLDAALELAGRIAEREGSGEIIVAGGGTLYEAAMPVADRLYITTVSASPEGDTLFPPISPDHWKIVQRLPIARGARDTADAELMIYERS